MVCGCKLQMCVSVYTAITEELPPYTSLTLAPLSQYHTASTNHLNRRTVLLTPQMGSSHTALLPLASSHTLRPYNIKRIHVLGFGNRAYILCMYPTVCCFNFRFQLLCLSCFAPLSQLQEENTKNTTRLKKTPTKHYQ